MAHETVHRRLSDSRGKILADPWLFGIFLLLTASVLLFAVLPVLSVLRLAVTTGEGSVAQLLLHRLRAPLLWRTLGNTLLLGVASAVVSTIVGFILAFALTRTNLRGKAFIHLIALLPIISPPFVIALSMILLFGRSGLVTKELLGIMGANVFGFHSLLFIQVLAFTPIAYLNMRGMLMAIDSTLEDAAAVLGSSQWMIFSKITLPLSVPAILSSMLLVFVKSIEDFGNPLVIGGTFSTLAVEAYSQFIGYFNVGVGAMFASILLFPSLLAFMIHRYWISARSYVTVTGKPAAQSIRLVSPLLVGPLGLFCYAFVGLILALYGTVVAISFTHIPGIDWSFTTEHYTRVFTAGLRPLWNSMTLAGVATPVTVFGGIAIAYILTRCSFAGSALLRWGTLISFAAPGTIIGIGYVSLFNTPPLVLTGTALIIVAAIVVKTLQVGIEAGSNQLRQIDPAMDEAALTLGASRMRTIGKITLPLLKPAIFTATAYAFTRSLTTLSAVIFLVSANWTLITVTILNQVETLRMGLAAAYSVVLIAIVLALLGALQIVMGRTTYNDR
ncbi:iron ABC transporter permease [Ochrobactrum sp. Marseille-Q0166]|uniref:ABC transporter permease n=1 Tax=Ochrobactrum sp. Marseille-Q0166 TaxID=2761105 RepID=UPI001AEE3FFA